MRCGEGGCCGEVAGERGGGCHCEDEEEVGVYVREVEVGAGVGGVVELRLGEARGTWDVIRWA